MSDFQEELHSEGYEKVVIIAVGQSAQSNFNSNYCANSDLPLVLDQSPSLPIHNTFSGEHRSLVVMDVDGVTELYRDILNSTYFPLYEDDFRDVIISNYPSSMPGDVNGDGYVNVDDLLVVISQWGPCSGCSGDLNEDGVVGVDDLLVILAHWGQ